MIYNNCIDACFNSVKALDHFAFEGFKPSKERVPGHEWAVACAEVCNLVGRQTARGLCCSDLYELCARQCDECVEKCDKINHEHAKRCAEAAKKCAEACRQCQADCEKCEKDKKTCC